MCVCVFPVRGKRGEKCRQSVLGSPHSSNTQTHTQWPLPSEHLSELLPTICFVGTAAAAAAITNFWLGGAGSEISKWKKKKDCFCNLPPLLNQLSQLIGIRQGDVCLIVAVLFLTLRSFYRYFPFLLLPGISSLWVDGDGHLWLFIGIFAFECVCVSGWSLEEQARADGKEKTGISSSSSS